MKSKQFKEMCEIWWRTTWETLKVIADGFVIDWKHTENWNEKNQKLHIGGLFSMNCDVKGKSKCSREVSSVIYLDLEAILRMKEIMWEGKKSREKWKKVKERERDKLSEENQNRTG